MPELPEVEIAKRSLSNHILNKKILDVTIINPKLRYFLKKKDFTKIINKTVNAVERVSKYILLKFADQSVVLIHLGMTGRFYF
jgi:formamidopyrimidine-DNA glycosylase